MRTTISSTLSDRTDKPKKRLTRRILCSLLAVLSLTMATEASAAEPPVRSPASDTPAPGVIRTPLSANEVEGLPLALVFYDLKGSSGITGGDERARSNIEKAFGIKDGGTFNSQLVEAALMRVRKLDFLTEASYTLYSSDRPGYLVLVLSVNLGPKDHAEGPRGILAGKTSDIPVLYQNEKTKVDLLLNGALGLYTDVNPWFGNAEAFTGRSPIALDPADGDAATWFETTVEYGVGGVVNIGDTPLWAYGAVSFLTSFSSGQDLFRSDTRDKTAIEKAYGGVVFQPPGSEWVFNISAGRQHWQLNDGFLFSRYAAAANAGPIPGLYLNMRTAYEMAALFQAKRGDFRVEAFYLNPAELDFVDSGTTFAGVNMALKVPSGIEGSMAYYECIDSETAFAVDADRTIPRDGQQTGDLRIGTSRLFGVDGLELFTEAAYQTHRDVDWDAWAYYVRGGYTFNSLPWKPNLSYRYASFGGDDPSTDTYERFDAPLSSGLDTWVQGVVAKKTVTNSNLNSHRVRLNLVPSETFSLTFDYFWLMADESAGSSRNYAQELDLGIRWSISRNLYFLGVLGVAFPDDRLRENSGSDLDSWSTYQASLFWNL